MLRGGVELRWCWAAVADGLDLGAVFPCAQGPVPSIADRLGTRQYCAVARIMFSRAQRTSSHRAPCGTMARRRVATARIQDAYDNDIHQGPPRRPGPVDQARTGTLSRKRMRQVAHRRASTTPLGATFTAPVDEWAAREKGERSPPSVASRPRAPTWWGRKGLRPAEGSARASTTIPGGGTRRRCGQPFSAPLSRRLRSRLRPAAGRGARGVVAFASLRCPHRFCSSGPPARLRARRGQPPRVGQTTSWQAGTRTSRQRSLIATWGSNTSPRAADSCHAPRHYSTVRPRHRPTRQDEQVRGRTGQRVRPGGGG